MLKSLLIFPVLNLFVCSVVSAADKLVLVVELEEDLLSMSHNIDEFLFAPTRNYLENGERNINDMGSFPALKDQLAATALVRLDNEIIGFATEHEIIRKDPATQHPVADSMWIFRLHHPGLTGFMAVQQKEDAINVFSLAREVMDNPDRDWKNEWQMFLSTSGITKVQFASGDLAKYQGGVFEEYNGLNPGDLKNFGRFRGRIEFVIYPGKQSH
ncbi:MAG: hypothetical protein MI673_08275 [Thiotrichales bacterium]|nr:hypothetical protein [Thiotrichales bacterium]